MATSLSKLKSQIEKLQKRAASIQNVVIARIKKEIDKHGLSVADLFNSGSDEPSGSRGPRAAGKAAAKPKKAGAAKPAKFADGQGNTWHGIGKRPQWIHDALNAGKTLEEFLISTKATPAASSAKSPKAAKAEPAAKKPAAKSKAASVKASPTKTVAKAPAAKKAAKVAAAAAPAKAAKKAPTTSKAPAKKAPAKKAAAKKPARTTPQPAVAAADPAAAQN